MYRFDTRGLERGLNAALFTLAPLYLVAVLCIFFRGSMRRSSCRLFRESRNRARRKLRCGRRFADPPHNGCSRHPVNHISKHSAVWFQTFCTKIRLAVTFESYESENARPSTKALNFSVVTTEYTNPLFLMHDKSCESKVAFSKAVIDQLKVEDKLIPWHFDSYHFNIWV